MIVIAGAGIGGLTLGCALARAGWPFVIYERAPGLNPVGAGIALSLNAFRALAHLDLDAPARASGQAVAEAAICDWRGRVLTSSRLPELAGVVAMARTSLQRVLLDALEVPVETGRGVVGYELGGSGVTVELEGGDRVEAELLIGADGLRSSVRQAMRGEEPLRYAGHTTWRALVDDVELERPDRMTESWGPGLRFGIAPIGPRRVYWFAVADAPPGGKDDGEGPSLAARFAGWHAPIEALIAATPAGAIVRTDVFDRPPIDRWIDGRVALLGDAAHPMTPNLGQGGGQAIEDAVVLADALTHEADIDTALARYQDRRLPRANDFVVRSHRLGRLAHVRSAPLRWLRDQALRAVPAKMTARAALRDLDFHL